MKDNNSMNNTLIDTSHTLRGDIKEFASYCEGIGAELVVNDSYLISFKLNTHFGPLLCSVYKDKFTKTGKHRSKEIACIFCRFSQDAEYKHFTSSRLNKYSGKWNFIEYSWNDCRDSFIYEVNEIKK